MGERTDAGSLSVYDHLRPPAVDALDPGVYRVVGASGDAVALLRVGDADGRRIHTGAVATVPRGDLDGYEAAENPDQNRPLTTVLASRLDGLWWSMRLVGATVVERPLPSAVALGFVAVGLFGDPFVPVPDAGDALLILLGAIALAFLSRTGSTR